MTKNETNNFGGMKNTQKKSCARDKNKNVYSENKKLLKNVT